MGFKLSFFGVETELKIRLSDRFVLAGKCFISVTLKSGIILKQDTYQKSIIQLTVKITSGD